ncbi:hypothetical protein EMWEY_00055090, partial [Eimeria maxima]
MARSCGTRDQDKGYNLQGVPTGALAWTHCSEEGFVTVKILHCDTKTGKARVEIDPEGASSVVAAQAAADVVSHAWASRSITPQEKASSVDNVSKCQALHNTLESSETNASPEKRKIPRREKRVVPSLLDAPEAATQAFADPLSTHATSGFETPSSAQESDTDDDCEGPSDAQDDPSSCTTVLASDLLERPLASAQQLQQRASTAAAAAADAFRATFISKPPFEVP